MDAGNDAKPWTKRDEVSYWKRMHEDEKERNKSLLATIAADRRRINELETALEALAKCFDTWGLPIECPGVLLAAKDGEIAALQSRLERAEKVVRAADNRWSKRDNRSENAYMFAYNKWLDGTRDVLSRAKDS